MYRNLDGTNLVIFNLIIIIFIINIQSNKDNINVILLYTSSHYINITIKITKNINIVII